MDSTAATVDHIKRVQRLLDGIRENLTQRARCHDASKLIEPEKSAFDRLESLKLSDIPYGSDEYRAALKSESPAIRHHYEVNDHHPEHHPAGIASMSLMAIEEMLADWKAASERVRDGSLEQSFDHNVTRFGFSPEIEQILFNTAKELGWLT